MKIFTKSIGVFVVALAVTAILAFTAMVVSAQSDNPDWRLPVTGLTVSAGDDPGELVINWDAHTQTTKTFLNYRVAWTPEGESFKGASQTDWNVHTTSTQHTVTGLDAGANYQVKVRTRYEGNQGSRWSGVVTGQSGGTPNTPASVLEPEGDQGESDKSDGPGQSATPRFSHIAAPTNLRVTSRTVDSITFAWNAPSDNMVTHTFIKRIFSGTTLTNTYSDVRTSFTVTSVPQNTSVDFTVAWATGNAVSDRGAQSIIVPKTLEDKQAQNLTTSEITSESVTLTWDNPTNYNVTGYKIERRTGNSGSYATLEDITTSGTRFTDSTVSANTTYTYRVTIKHIPSGSILSVNGESVTLNVTTSSYSDIAAPTNFRITNATLTSGVYVLASHDDHPALAWNRPLATTGYKFTRKWIDSDATCGNSCPWLVVALAKGTGHSYFTDRYIAPGKYTFRVRGLDTTNNPGAAAEITVKLPDGPPFVPEAPTNLSVTGGRYGSAGTLEGSWNRNDSPPHKIPRAFVVQWKSGNQAYPTGPTGDRSFINAWSGPHMLGADGNDQWSPAWNKFKLRHNLERNGVTPSLSLDTEYTVRVGMCLTTACTLDDAVFATERTVRTAAAP